MSPEFGKEIIETVHQQNGHIGPSLMYPMIRLHNYFKGLHNSKHNFFKCKVCIENRSRAIGLLSKFGPGSKPFQIMSIDSVGDFEGN